MNIPIDWAIDAASAVVGGWFLGIILTVLVDLIDVKDNAIVIGIMLCVSGLIVLGYTNDMYLGAAGIICTSFGWRTCRLFL